MRRAASGLVLSEGLIEANDGEEGLLKSLEFCKRWQGKARGRIRTMLGPHAPYTCSREYLIKIGELARANNLSLHIHIAETRKEYEDFLNTYGSTPVQYLDSFGFFEIGYWLPTVSIWMKKIWKSLLKMMSMWPIIQVVI